MKIWTQLVLGFVLIFAFMIGIALVTYWALASSTETAKWVSHTHEVIAKAQKIEKLLVDMETGQRGFLLTGANEFLKPYNEGREEYTTTFTGLEKLISDNPAQSERIKRIDTLVRKWWNVAAEVEISERRKVVEGAVDVDFLSAILAKGTGKSILDEMRQIIDEMEAEFELDGNTKGNLLARAVAKAMVDQETGQRGFLITGKAEFLEPFLFGQEKLKSAIFALRTLIANSHDRISTDNDLREVEGLAGKWLRLAGNPEIELRRQVDAGQAAPCTNASSSRKNSRMSCLWDCAFLSNSSARALNAAASRFIALVSFCHSP